MNSRSIIFIAFILLLCTSCRKEKEMTLSGLDVRDFQTEVDGQLTNLYVLKNQMEWRFVLQTTVGESYR